MFTLLRYMPVIAPAVTWSCLHGCAHRQRAAMLALACMWIVEKLTKQCLHGVHEFMRPRPCMHKVFTDRIMSGTCGFPSGHTAQATFCALVACARYGHLVSVALVLTALSAFERIRMGCHTYDQCAAGVALGACTYGLFLGLTRALRPPLSTLCGVTCS